MCKIEDCSKDAFATGLCKSHYYKNRSAKNGPCSVDGCTRGAVMGKLKLCQTHYYRTDEQVSLALQRTYGITLAEYDSLFAAQGGKCAICLGDPKGRNAVNGRFDVDHCHKTGRVRGLLCGDCNTSLGKLNDDVPSLQRAIQYLEGNK